jgi:hypothetical protein
MNDSRRFAPDGTVTSLSEGRVDRLNFYFAGDKVSMKTVEQELSVGNQKRKSSRWYQ